MKMSKQQLEVKLHLLEAAAIVTKGGDQKDVRAKFGDTMGQKLWFILLLDRRFPKVELIKRLTELEPQNPKFLKFSVLQGSYLPSFAVRSDPNALKEHILKMRTAGQEPWPELTEEMFEDFLVTPIAKENRAKIMSHANIEILMNEFPVGIIQNTARAILANDMDVLKKYAIKAALINGVIDAVMRN